MILTRYLVIPVFILFCHLAYAEEAIVAVAANFTAAMNDIVSAFEKETGHTIKLSFGSSGKFYAQIKNGAPFQAFFSADQAKPMALERDGLVVPGSRFTYATGALALWSTRADLAGRQVEALKEGWFNKLAIANPELAPYGAASVEVLRSLGIEAAVRPKLVTGENIAQAYQYVSTGSADLGFVALSQIKSRGSIKDSLVWIVPHDLYNTIRQDAVLLKSGAQNKAVRDLLQFVRGKKAVSIIEFYGYRTDMP